MTESTTADVAPDEDGGLWRGDAGELLSLIHISEPTRPY